MLSSRYLAVAGFILSAPAFAESQSFSQLKQMFSGSGKAPATSAAPTNEQGASVQENGMAPATDAVSAKAGAAAPAEPVSVPAVSASVQAAAPVPLPVAEKPVVPTINIRTGLLSIQTFSAIQARELETEQLKQMGIGGIPLAASSSAPAEVVPTVKAKPVRIPPAKPYLTEVVGIVGEEIASFRLHNGREVNLRAGDAIERWEITQIHQGRVRVTLPARKKNKGTSSMWLNVGDSLK